MRNLGLFLSRGLNVLGVVIVCLYVAVAIAAPTLAPPEDPDVPSDFRRVGRSIDHTPHPPSAIARLGTLPGQMDVYYTVVWGTRSALRFGLLAAFGSATIGTLIGVVGGYLGGWVNKLAMGIVDAFLAFPAIAGLWLVQRVFFSAGQGGTFTGLANLLSMMGAEPLLVTLILFSWMPYARIINAGTLRLMQTDYVLAARALGSGGPRILLRHLLPNSISPAIVLVARDIGGMVMLAAAFTFVGFAGGSSWGALLALGRDWIISPGGNPLVYWWTYLPASLALLLFGIGWNLIGDGLNYFFTTTRATPSREETARRGGASRWFVTAAALALGIALGLGWSWGVDPVRTTDLAPSSLRPEHRADYLRMTIDSFAVSMDIDLAMRRYQQLGAFGEEAMDDVLAHLGTVNYSSVRTFRLMVRTLGVYYSPFEEAGPTLAERPELTLMSAGLLAAGLLLTVLGGVIVSRLRGARRPSR
jgi:peptide/nickel transport system permease protein